MTTVLLSIKPEFAEKIFAGTKKYEFRKSIFKRTDIHKVLVYASFPIQKVIGEFQIEQILGDRVDNIWEKTSKYSGISQEFFQTYFENKEKAYAIKVGKVHRYEEARALSDYNVQVAPQSFIYIHCD